MIPLVSTLCQGPLGVAQLPRLWWKNLLHQAGQLDEDYPFCSGGLDKYVLEVLRIDQDSALRFLWDQRPNYLQFEEWVTAAGYVRGRQSHCALERVAWCRAPTIGRTKSTRPMGI